MPSAPLLRTDPASSALDRAREWSELDPNPTTARYVEDLVAEASSSSNSETARKALSSLFPHDRRIAFGTAGLRSEMKPGPLGMNDLVAIQTTQGLAKCCASHPDNDDVLKKKRGERPKAVIGYDHRSRPSLDLSSRRFATYAALVFREAGYDPMLFAGYVHTPMVPYATVKLGAIVGVMITASHNPKNDDGYKVYWNDGIQIRPPYDGSISESISENLKPWVDYGRTVVDRERDRGGGGEDDGHGCLGLSDAEITSEMLASYYEAIASSGLVTGISKRLRCRSGHRWSPPKIAYTAMHGVGLPFAVRSYETFGLEPFLAVPGQCDPDPEFPTVSFPNPEERGALDVATAFADKEGCDVVLANDPDADRLAVAERVDRRDGTKGNGWVVFTGDQIGVMLGHWLWETMGKKGNDPRPAAMCASAVSSSMLSTVASVEGFAFEEALTGFKWIGSRAASLRERGHRPVFLYEEAIGYCCGDVVLDKDGISALGVVTELICSVYGRDSNLSRHMQGLYDKYGEFVSRNGYYHCRDPDVVRAIVDGMRNDGRYLRTVGGYEVRSIRDLGEPGYDSETPDNRPTLPTSASSPMMTFRFKNGCVASFRGSGTEPKLKYYIEMKGRPGVPREEVRKNLDRMVDVILEELLKPRRNGLVTPKASL